MSLAVMGKSLMSSRYTNSLTIPRNLPEISCSVRGALINAREGVDGMTWFFFSDEPTGNGLFSKSGLLTHGNGTNFIEKPVYYSMHNLVNLLGDYHHIAAIQESNESYIYVWKRESGEKNIWT